MFTWKRINATRQNFYLSFYSNYIYVIISEELFIRQLFLQQLERIFVFRGKKKKVSNRKLNLLRRGDRVKKVCSASVNVFRRWCRCGFQPTCTRTISRLVCRSMIDRSFRPATATCSNEDRYVWYRFTHECVSLNYFKRYSCKNKTQKGLILILTILFDYD